MFSFLKKLFKNNNDRPKIDEQDNINLDFEPQIELRMGILSTPVPYSDIPFDLREYIAGRGHDEFPCLDPIYSPSSMIPCVDFTPWIIAQIRSGNIIDIKHLAYAIHRGNMAYGPSWSEYNNDTNTEIDKILRLPIESYIIFDDEQAYYEFKAALIMIIIRYDIDMRIFIKEDTSKYLAQIMFPYWLSIDETIVVGEANKLVRKIKKDDKSNPYWSETWHFDKTDVVFYQDANLKNLQNLLKRINLAARCHFFDVIASKNFAETPKILESCTFYKTRMYGIDSTETSRELFQVGLFDKCTDPLIILTIFTKEQLLEKYSGIPNLPKKSWKKVQIIEFLVQNYPKETQAIVNQLYVGLPSVAVTKVRNELDQYLNKAERFYTTLLAAIINLVNKK